MADDETAGPKSGPPSGDGAGGNGADQEGVADAGRSGADLAGEVERARAELAAAQDRALREHAELENVKKRLAREKADALRFANEGLLRDLLPIIDNLHRALEHARTARDMESLTQGIELVLRALSDALARHGVRSVEARGAAFDPSVHEAIGHVESDAPANTVVDEHQRGYLMHERLLRPALVTVAKGRAEGRSGVESGENDG